MTGSRDIGLIRRSLPTHGKQYGLIAQSVEQRIENPRVGGSIPPQATILNTLKFLTP